MSADLAVIGGGPAGLSAAWSLASAGSSVTLYERDEIAGGLLRTSELEGVAVDVAVQLLGSYYTATLDLMRGAGGGALLVRAPGRDALWRGGRAEALTYGSVVSMAGSGALPTGLKFRLASRYILYLRRHSGILDAANPVRAHSLDHESIASWGERELGSDFVELLSYPQLAAYYGTIPEETSAGFYHTLAEAGLDLHLYAIAGGVGEFGKIVTSGLQARGVEVRYGVEVSHLSPEGTGVSIEWQGGRARHDGVVLAIPAPALTGVIDGGGALREWIGGVRYSEEAVVVLSIEGSVPADYFGLAFPRTTAPGEKIAAICVQSQKGAGLVAEGRESLVVIPAPTVMREIVRAEPREALETILPAVEMVYPGVRERVRRARVYRFPSGRAIFYPGYLNHLTEYDPAWLPDQIVLAGDYLVSPTVEGAVRSGALAANRLIASTG